MIWPHAGQRGGRPIWASRVRLFEWKGTLPSGKVVLFMSQNSSIEWTDNTWNPVRGCTKVSPGCKHCYAETFAERFRGVPGHPFEQGFDVLLAPWKLLEPFHWSESKLVFTNSMSDLFNDEVTDQFIVAAFEVMAAADWHTYQVLTKRPARMRRMLKGDLEFAAGLPHIWWGTSVEDRKYGLPRVDLLRKCEVARRFLSCEPLLEDLGKINVDGIGWVIAGGESGRDARPMRKEWVTSLRDQCSSACVPFFFKQWGGFPKGKLGSKLDEKEYKAFPPLPNLIVPSLARRQRIEVEVRKQLQAVGILEQAA